jgi:hypothetical protein
MGLGLPPKLADRVQEGRSCGLLAEIDLKVSGRVAADAPSTALCAVPLPRFAGAEEDHSTAFAEFKLSNSEER